MNLSSHLMPFVTQVESGELRSCKAIKALIKHIRYCFEHEDIYVDEERMDNYMRLVKYLPFSKVFPWEEFVITLHLCTFWRDTGLPRWDELFCEIGRGAGKDGIIAWESLCLISQYNGIAKYDVDICANNEDQALRPVLDLTETFDNSASKPLLKKHFKWTTEKIKSIKTRGTIRGRTNNPKGKDGMRSGLVVFNEFHQYSDYKNVNVFVTGLGKVPHPRRAIFTTNGDVREGPLDDKTQIAKEILFQGEPDNGMLPFICELEEESQVHDPANWEMANPSLQYLPSLRLEYEKEYREWSRNRASLPAFLQKRMNLVVSDLEYKVTDYANIKATNKELPDLSGQACVIGIDFSKLSDWASVCAHFKRGDIRYDHVHTWVCLASRDLERIKAPWQEWAKSGRITIVDDVEISPKLIETYIDRLKCSYAVKGAALDSFRYTLLSESLQSLGFEPKKTLRLYRPSDIMKVVPVIDSVFARQNFIWGDAPEVRWATNNTKLVKVGRNPLAADADMGNWIYGKIEYRSRKTDPFMSLVAAMTIEDWLPQAEERNDNIDILTW